MYDFKILVVEDQPIYRKLLTEIIESKKFKFIEAHDGESGLEMFKKHKPDLVFCDVLMPKVDGLQLLKSIKKIKPDTVVVMVTAHDCEDWVIEAIESGASNYLKKPVAFKEMSHILDKYYKIANNKSISKNIMSVVEEKQLLLKFESNIQTIPLLVDYLINETGDKIKELDRFGFELGLNELIMNSVEHGNLEIGREEKQKALDKNKLNQLYKTKLKDPELANRTLTVKLHINKEIVEIEIIDEGKGFDWQKISDSIRTNDIESLGGKGIFLSKYYFDELEYIGKGNIVRVVKNIN
jgi:YesN/AraC family two-component response regulator